MRKIILLFVIAFSIVNISYAIKAKGGATLIKQSDGTSLTVYAYGDAFFHWYTTTDGVLLYNEGTDFFVAALDGNNISNTFVLAHEKDKRSKKETELCNKQNNVKGYIENGIAEGNALRWPTPTRAYTPGFFFHEGSPKVLVLLVDFTDRKFLYSDKDTKNIFNQYLNADGRPEYSLLDQNGKNMTSSLRNNLGSAKKYFKDMSFGKFTPQFDIQEPIHLNNTLHYYGNGNNDRMDLLIPDACKIAVQQGVDFSQYDADNDGYVDLIYIIYAGYSQSYSGNSSDCIWPKVSSYTPPTTYCGKKLYLYGVNNELNARVSDVDENGYPLINGIGLFCHEFSHTLGLPDLYADQSVGPNNQGMEYWSLMDSGSYCNSSYYPTAYTAWERAYFGWMELKTLTEPGNYQLYALNKAETPLAYRIYNDQDALHNEYYILENIQNNSWNSALGYINSKTQKSDPYKSHGLMITHVDFDEWAFTIGNQPNSVTGKPRMTIIPADGTLTYNNRDGAFNSMHGDLFPGSNNVTEFKYRIDGYTNKIVYYGSADYMAETKPIFNIHENDNIIYFTFINDPETGINGIHNHNETNSPLYNMAGQKVGNDYKGLIIKGGKKYFKK